MAEIKATEILIKSKFRVQKHGEVFTPAWMVKKMLDIEGIKEFAETLTANFLEPAAGTGNFMVAIQERKLNMVKKNYCETLTQYENYSLIALASIYGIELLEDNAQECVMNMYEYYHDKFGLGEKTGIEVNEDNGHIYTPDTAEGNEVRYSTMTFGQGMTLTMIQVAAGFCSVVNGGQYFQPTVVDGVMDKTGVLTPSQHTSLRQTVSAEVSSQMREMLHVARSTTWLGREDRAGYMIGGKTGTSETVRDGAYTQSETEATYIGYGGVDHPEYVIMVRVAAPGKGLNLEGGLHAGPIFTDVSNRMIDYMKLAPRN